MSRSNVPIQAWNALIRTHHITSKKKITSLRQACAIHDVFVLLRGGGSPGIMYVEGEKQGVESWIDVVQRLRYKDYQLAARPAMVVREDNALEISDLAASGLHETGSVKDFGQTMQARGVYAWWRKGMGYAGPDESL